MSEPAWAIEGRNLGRLIAEGKASIELVEWEIERADERTLRTALYFLAGYLQEAPPPASEVWERLRELGYNVSAEPDGG